MNVRLNETLRPLRLQAGLTQAALAEQLGVSDRAVSRWELGEAYPDVALLPDLAMALHVSVDALLGADPLRIHSEIIAATEECTRLLREEKPAEALSLMREQNIRYPNQPELMVYLARTLIAHKTEEAAREALSLCRAADGRPMRLSTTFGCKQVMAKALHRLHQPEQAARLIEDDMPAIWVCRELLLPRYTQDPRATQLRRSNVRLFSQLLMDTLDALARSEDNEACHIAAEHIREEINRIL